MKKFIFLLFLPLFGHADLFAQTPEREEYNTVTVEKMPEFPGGEKGLATYLRQNVVYADSLQKKRIEGMVYLNFTIDETGQVYNVKVLRGVHPALDAEALRVVKAMPNWKPGTQKGQPVKVQFNLPIQFKL